MSEEPHQGHSTGTLLLRHQYRGPWGCWTWLSLGPPHRPNAFATNTFNMKYLNCLRDSSATGPDGSQATMPFLYHSGKGQGVLTSGSPTRLPTGARRGSFKTCCSLVLPSELLIVLVWRVAGPQEPLKPSRGAEALEQPWWEAPGLDRLVSPVNGPVRRGGLGLTQTAFLHITAHALCFLIPSRANAVSSSCTTRCPYLPPMENPLQDFFNSN